MFVCKSHYCRFLIEWHLLISQINSCKCIAVISELYSNLFHIQICLLCGMLQALYGFNSLQALPDLQCVYLVGLFELKKKHILNLFIQRNVKLRTLLIIISIVFNNTLLTQSYFTITSVISSNNSHFNYIIYYIILYYSQLLYLVV